MENKIPLLVIAGPTASGKTACAVELGQGILTQAELLSHRLPEMPASLVPVIEEIWLNEVVGK